MQFKLPLFLRQSPAPDALQVGGRAVPLVFARQHRARRYILRVSEQGAARVTIPRGGSEAEARKFVQRHLAWLEEQFQKRAKQSAPPRQWTNGTTILYRGELTRLECGEDRRHARLGELIIPLRDEGFDLRAAVERHLRKLAQVELGARTLALAALHQSPVRRVTVRDQRSRWGSCSSRGTISLNWRLIQTPGWVRDYLIVHELMHFREMNHSPRFWAWVAAACPEYRQAERWLNQHARWLR